MHLSENIYKHESWNINTRNTHKHRLQMLIFACKVYYYIITVTKHYSCKINNDRDRDRYF